MRLIWQIDPEDIVNVKAFYVRHFNNSFVQERIENNLRDEQPEITKDQFWQQMVACLLTTQQRSGPTSPVVKFILAEPFPLDYEISRKRDDLAEFVRTVLSEFGGLRRSTIICKELATNLLFLISGGWELTFSQLDEVRLNSNPETERKAASFIADNFKGFGPKQSRNLLQCLGISRYEIPIDSRITKWLNEFGFPVKLAANALQDRNYYNFVSDGFQRLADACDIVPCVLDAVIFSSFDDAK